MNDEQGFAAMFEKSSMDDERLKPGQKIEAVVVRVAREWVFIDLGGKSEGAISKQEFLNEDGEVTVQEGDTVQAYFLSEKNNELLFTLRVGGAAAHSHLEEAYESGIPVEGTVQKEVKGGFEIKIGGNVRGFCPFSQLDLRRVEDNEAYIGQKLSFRIQKYSEQGRNIVVSRRVVLEEERAQQKEALKESLAIGQSVQGTITSVRDFGAFVDIGGLEGLIPISEIAWGQVDDIHERVAVGQEVEVTVKKLDWENDRFSFSLKETLPDPWESVLNTFPEGTCHNGKVVRLTDFGAFVNLAPGIDGLVHISKLGAGRRIKHPREVVKQGDVIEVRVDSVDIEQKRISLSLPAPAGSEAAKGQAEPSPERVERESYAEFKKKGKEKSKSMGTLGDLLKAKMEKK